MPGTLKFVWTVTAGTVRGVPEQAHTRQYPVLAEEWDAMTNDERVDLFRKKRAKAHQYASDLTDPRRFNWVVVEFLWT